LAAPPGFVYLGAPMPKPRPILTLALLPLALSLSAGAQVERDWEVSALTPESGVTLELKTGIATFTNGVMIRYGQAVLTADRATVNKQTGETTADGHVRIQQEDLTWIGEHSRYNFKTRQMEAAQFRAGKTPVFAAGEELRGDMTNRIYTGRNAYITTDDVDAPFEKIRASSIKIIPGKRIEARNATLYLGGVPVFYFPYYSRTLGERVNNFNFTPGYRSRFGPYLLGRYTWFWNDQFDGILHLDYRERRGVGVGPDLNAHFGRWGDATLKYYFLRDQDPGTNIITGLPIPQNRQRLDFAYHAMPFTNFDVKAVARYQSDSRVTADFFEGEYRQNAQPNTFVEVNKLWQNFSLDAYVQPRLNDFLETVERLPEVKLTGFRQQLGPLPVFYESESSAGYYRRLFAATNGPPAATNYSASRADTYHQLLLPQTFFGWLNVTPRVGGRLDYYGQSTGPGGTNDDAYRGVFNTGAEVSFKASRTWPGMTNGLLALDGLRHIIEPSVNYVFVPAPHPGPNELPQFDYELPSLKLLPIEYPDYNAIDSVDSQNTLRFGLRNKLQTKRDGQVEDLLTSEIYTDWRLRPRAGQTTFADVYSDLTFKPRSWITFESQTRYDIADGIWRMAFHNLTLQPNDRWSWGLGHWYLRDDFSASPTALGAGNNLFTSTFFYRVNENWALRARHVFEARTGRMEEQSYSLYRDLRSWTTALTFRVLDNGTGPQDFSVALTFSLKAHPRFALGDDAVRPYYLLGN
jgi:LPS-assembly protein